MSVHRKLSNASFVSFLGVGSIYLGFVLYYETVVARNPDNWEIQHQVINNVQAFDIEPAGKMSTNYSYVVKGEKYFADANPDNGVARIFDAQPGELGYAEVQIEYLKPWGPFRHRMESGGLLLSCPRKRWLFHMPAMGVVTSP